LTNDFSVNLLDMGTKSQKSATSEGVLEGRNRATGELKWTATVVDLFFGSNSQSSGPSRTSMRAATHMLFMRDFVAAWNKVMNLDHFDRARSQRAGQRGLIHRSRVLALDRSTEGNSREIKGGYAGGVCLLIQTDGKIVAVG
jgi:hypothetical protein